jgi:UDP-glucuronate 4-epimerase
VPESILVTGAAGFIGSHLSERLVGAGHRVIGLDNFCDFYDPNAKRANIESLLTGDAFDLIEADIRDADAVHAACAAHAPSFIVHIAAMAGVRPSIADPALYTRVNLDGTVHLLDAAVKHGVGKFIFASSSSVYGNNEKTPFAEDDPVNDPISPYAATKRAGELLCHTYWHLHRLPITCLRFFTVFGPRQRPDLAISRFLHCVAEDRPIPMYGDGSTSRDYTYIDDIINGVTAAIDRGDRFRIYNLGGSDPVTLRTMIDTIEQVTGRTARIDQQPMQPGDVNRTFADVRRAQEELGYVPRTGLAEGIARQWAWMQQRTNRLAAGAMPREM